LFVEFLLSELPARNISAVKQGVDVLMCNKECASETTLVNERYVWLQGMCEAG
jgi:hypothetical protein